MNIGLVAQGSRKKLMQNFCIAYHNVLGKHRLYATGSTGGLVEDVTGLTVHKYLGGDLGGAEQLANQIAENNLDMVIFFREDLDKPNPVSIQCKMILSMCDQYSIPLATNLATAELLVRSLENGDLEWREMYH